MGFGQQTGVLKLELSKYIHNYRTYRYSASNTLVIISILIAFFCMSFPGYVTLSCLFILFITRNWAYNIIVPFWAYLNNKEFDYIPWISINTYLKESLAFSKELKRDALFELVKHKIKQSKSESIIEYCFLQWDWNEEQKNIIDKLIRK